MAPPATTKRKPEDREPPISPPPVKRKIQSSVSKTSVTTFFTPLSQRPKSPVSWEERPPVAGALPTLLVAKYKPSTCNAKESRPRGKQRVAIFDLDSTLITTASGKKHGTGPGDWKWLDATVQKKLKELHEEGYAMAILSNQGGLALHPNLAGKKLKNQQYDRVADFKEKCTNVLSDLGIEIMLYAATGKDNFRKPRTGMWEEMCKDLGLVESDIDHDHSIFVGDAGGRIAYMRNGKSVPKDFSCSDRNLAANIGIMYQTPEEYFLGEAPLEFERGFNLEDHPFIATKSTIFEKRNDNEVIVFCGAPGAGKSTFYRSYLQPLGYERVNQDTLKSKDKCVKAAEAYLNDGKSIIIDNTNPDQGTRALWIDLAKQHNVPVRCVWFQTSSVICEHNDAVRSLNKSLNPDKRDALPKIAFNTFFSRFKEPRVDEGFVDITEVKFEFRGTKEEYALWGRYWL